VDKDEATREKIQQLKEELVEIGQEFDRNIRDDVRHIYLDSANDLAGLPKDYIEAHQPDDTGKIKITTQYPDYIPFLTYAKSGEARERIYKEFKNRAFPQNRDTLNRLVAKRHELANTLGYESWAAYITEDKMAKTQKKVADFIEQLNEAAKERAARDYAMLLERKQKDDPNAVGVTDWEKSYYGELVKAEQYDFDSQELRNYYDYPQVKDGILNLTSMLFGVSYKAIPDAEVWHESVDCYEIYEGDELMGRFYLDMHPREGKYGHAAHFGLRSGVLDVQIPEAVLVCNFPGGNGDGPALMEHDDVETFLHEFGHLLHSLFGGHQRWIDFSGVATEWDFVEAPSQLLEEWSLDPKTLQTFAKHHETGEPIPAELIQKLRVARDFGNGTYVTQQNFYTSISLNIYNRDPSEVDLDKMQRELEERYGSFEFIPGTHMYANFGHLEGYSAMYYTYMWSLVIAKDLFSGFDPDDMLNPETATEYRKKVLDPGGTRDASELIQDFLGREYNFEAFRNWLNRGAS
jgi:thimet oligopeptidase